MWSMADTEMSRHAVISKTLSHDEAIHLVKTKRYIHQLKKEFESAFAIFPFICSASIFSESTGIVMFMIHEAIDIGLVRLSISGINVIMICAFLLVVDHIQSAEKERNQLIVDKSWDQLSGVNFEVGHRVRAMFSQWTPLTAIFFQLDSTVILSLAGSLVSFTIMLLQLRSD
ncbi:hypothetical protein HDE_06926 [Halotydeus destructor]|nr:hypothetical protein HDE_06926 [Halotydeus destructor]